MVSMSLLLQLGGIIFILLFIYTAALLLRR